MRWFALALVLASGCADKKKNENGLEPAQNWGADPGQLAPAAPPNPHGGGGPAAADMSGAMPQGHPNVEQSGQAGPIDPSAPMPPGHPAIDPGQPGPVDPNAQMPSGHPPIDQGGTDVSKLNLPAPDPNRPIDPAHHIKGVIKIHPKAADRVKAGGAVFVVVKRADAAGQPTGTPLAVDKLTWQKDELAFEMTEKQAMIAGTQLTGDVVITARYDQDGDAISKQPGDIVGQMRVTIPADSVKLFLDQVLP
jgi:hypothetical protein